MPTVPKSLVDLAKGDPGLLTSGTRPDASSILMAASLMHGQAGLPRGSGSIERLGPRSAKAPKGSTAKGMLR